MIAIFQCQSMDFLTELILPYLLFLTWILMYYFVKLYVPYSCITSDFSMKVTAILEYSGSAVPLSHKVASD